MAIFVSCLSIVPPPSYFNYLGRQALYVHTYNNPPPLIITGSSSGLTTYTWIIKSHKLTADRANEINSSVRNGVLTYTVSPQVDRDTRNESRRVKGIEHDSEKQMKD